MQRAGEIIFFLVFRDTKSECEDFFNLSLNYVNIIFATGNTYNCSIYNRIKEEEREICKIFFCIWLTNNRITSVGCMQ